MKNVKAIIFFVLITILSACNSNPRPTTGDVMIRVFDFVVQSDIDWSNLKTQILNIDGVRTCTINEKEKYAGIVYSLEKLSDKQLASLITDKTSIETTIHEFPVDENAKACPMKAAWSLWD